MQARFVLVTALAGLLVAAPASATPNFPGAIADHLGLAAQPDCTLCHVGTPGFGTVTTPFGISLRSRGAKASDEAALRTALDALAGERKDSDKDGTTDIEELRIGEDPNGGGAGPEYGCMAAPAAPTNFTFWGLLLLAAFGFGRWRARGDRRARFAR